MLPRHDCESEWKGASVSKNIRAGTWWLDQDGDNIYIVMDGRLSLPAGVLNPEFPFIVLYRHEGGVFVAQMNGSELVRELPGCTGFDYEEPSVTPMSNDGPAQWIPVMGVDGQVYHCLGYPSTNR